MHVPWAWFTRPGNPAGMKTRLVVALSTRRGEKSFAPVKPLGAKDFSPLQAYAYTDVGSLFVQVNLF